MLQACQFNLVSIDLYPVPLQVDMASGAVATHCRVCKRSFQDTPNPVVKDPKPGDLLKRHGTLAQCNSCVSFLKKYEPVQGMSKTELTSHLNDDANFDQYMDGLEQWESNRREGKRAPRSTSTSVQAESKQGLSTRQLKGYLWTRDVLEKTNETHLLKKGKTTSISHMGKTVTGILREQSQIGCIEVYEDSSHTAVRKRVLASGSDASAAADCEEQWSSIADKARCSE